MKIGPNPKNQALSRLPEPPAQAPNRTAPDECAGRNAQTAPEGLRNRQRQDIVQLSGAEGAHRLELYSRPGPDIKRVAEAAGRSFGAEKLERIQQRIESGFYDRPEVKEKIAERMAEDLIEGDHEPGEIDNDYGIGDY
jgi:hypothetical protein